MANITLAQYIGRTLYPVGSVYITIDYSTTVEKLQALYGGTWYKTSSNGGVFFPAAGSTYTKWSNYGSNNAVLISHSHTVASGGGHTHSGKYKENSSYNDKGDPVWTYNGTGHGTKSGVFLASDGTHTHVTGAPNSSYAVRSSGTDFNRPPYVTVFYFHRTA